MDTHGESKHDASYGEVGLMMFPLIFPIYMVSMATLIKCCKKSKLIIRIGIELDNNNTFRVC